MEDTGFFIFLPSSVALILPLPSKNVRFLLVSSINLSMYVFKWFIVHSCAGVYFTFNNSCVLSAHPSSVSGV